ncbi:MAG TPA: sigma-70 family RNA polymerase sigma factor [Candidatus Acidoferrales bacterium]
MNAPTPMDLDDAALVDAALVDAARNGDRAAFGQLYQRYQRMVHGVLLTRVPPGDVPDLVQEVFLLAMRKLGSLREPGAFGGWLAMIARNRATDFFRRRRETDELPEQMPGQQSKSPEAKEAFLAIQSLPEAYREPLILRLVEGLTGQEIADRTGLKPASVRVNLHRGMKMLRQKLGWSATDA